MSSINPTEVKYRANVAGILRNDSGHILLCERLGVAEAWQFPQGGVDPGETPEQALTRELREEIGLLPRHFTIVEQRGPYRYLYEGRRQKKGYHGKEQLYFLCDFHGEDCDITVDTAHPEFQAHRWIAPAHFQIAWLPEIKRAVYRQVFTAFFGLKI